MTSTSPTRRSLKEDFGADAPEAVAGIPVEPKDDDEVSLFALANVLLRWRKPIIALAFLGGVLGLAKGFSGDRLYKSTAIFIPQTGGGSTSPSGLALAASQFGINIPSPGGGWGPPMYVELIKSRALLAPLAFDTVVVVEEGRSVPMMELLKANALPTPERQMTKAAAGLAGMVSATEEKKLVAVKVNVVTRWPSVSLALANRLLERVNEFNLQTRKSQALSERKFVEAQTLEAERALRDAEDRLLDFMKRNRAIEGSPELVVMRDRLQREVTHRQMSYTSWVQSREEARIREVRDTPVITVLEEPRLPLVVEPRRSLRKGILGGLVGLILGCVIAFGAEGITRARRARGSDAREFFSLLRTATPRFMRRA